MKNFVRDIILLFCLTLVVVEMRAQQAPIFTNYENSYATINPGFGGMAEGINILGIYRNQWTGFSDDNGNNVSPRTFLISGDMPIKALNGGLSLAILKDDIAFENDIDVNLGYSYHLDLGGGTLGIGLALALDNRTVDFSKMIVIHESDPVIPKKSVSDMLIDANLGVYYQVAEEYYAGVSVTNLLKSKGKELEGTASSSASFVGDRTFYLFGGYYIHLEDPRFIIEPSVCLLSNGIQTQFNLTGKFLYNKKFWCGVNYRNKESIDLMAGFRYKDFQLSYAYDINTMGLSISGSHEVAVSYIFKLDLEKSPRIYHSPRYL